MRPFDHVNRMEDECFGGSYQREVRACASVCVCVCVCVRVCVWCVCVQSKEM